MKKIVMLFMLLFAPFVVAQTPHKVSLHWTASVTPTVTHYGIFRGTVHNGPYVYIGYSTTLSYVNSKNPDGTPLVEGQTYYYVAVSYTATKGEFSANSNEAVATIPVAPAPATNVTADAQ